MLLANRVQFRKRKEIKKTKDKKFGPSTRRNKSRILEDDEKAEHAEWLACPVVIDHGCSIAWFSSFRQCCFNFTLYSGINVTYFW